MHYNEKIDSQSLTELQLSAIEMQQDPMFYIITLGRILLLLLRQKIEKGRELNFTKGDILFTLVLHNGCLTSTLLSKKVFKTKYAISRIIEQLENDGFVTIEKHNVSEDRRFKKIHITPKGIEFVKKQIPLMREFSQEVSSLLSPEEISSLNLLSQNFLNRILSKKMTGI